MMIGDQYAQAERLRMRHTVIAGDTTVDRDQQLGAGRGGKFCQCRRQAIAHANPVRYNVIDAARAERRQPADGYRNASRAVPVLVTGADERLEVGWANV